MTKILLTTTSFQDTPGEHHKLLADTGWDVIRARGPLNEADTLAQVGNIDGYICGDDLITRAVLEKARPRLKVISKYGIGVDKIDVKSCTEFGLPLLFTPGVNHTTVAEHTFLLLLALEKNFLFHTDSTRNGGWKRKTGHELLEKTIGIVGLGRIGKEVAIRARAFGMNVIAFDVYWDEKFATANSVKTTIAAVRSEVDGAEAAMACSFRRTMLSNRWLEVSVAFMVMDSFRGLVVWRKSVHVALGPTYVGTSAT